MDFFDENKTPADKFFEILPHASQEAVRQELEKLVERLAILELLAEEQMGEGLEQKIFEVRGTRKEELEERVQNTFLDLMSQILKKTTY